MTEHFETGSKKGRGMAQASLDLIEAMHDIAEECQPITGRGVGYVGGLPSFPASDKQKDPRFAWFVKTFGDRCWELDAMDPNDLRECVEEVIKDEIEPEAWKRAETCQEAEQQSLQTVLDAWGGKR